MKFKKLILVIAIILACCCPATASERRRMKKVEISGTEYAKLLNTKIGYEETIQNRQKTLNDLNKEIRNTKNELDILNGKIRNSKPIGPIDEFMKQVEEQSKILKFHLDKTKLKNIKDEIENSMKNPSAI